MSVSVVVVDEVWKPQAGVTIDALDLSAQPPTVAATAVSNGAGEAVFALSGGPYFFRPRELRVSTTVGERVYTGRLQVQLAQPGGGHQMAGLQRAAGRLQHPDALVPDQAAYPR